MQVWTLEYRRVIANWMAQEVRDRVYALLLKTMGRKQNFRKIIKVQAWWRKVRQAHKFY